MDELVKCTNDCRARPSSINISNVISSVITRLFELQFHMEIPKGRGEYFEIALVTR